jgi:cyclic pyranopterin phosphate synthase
VWAAFVFECSIQKDSGSNHVMVLSMTHGEPRAAIYAFEAIDEELPYMPLAARRVLDALGKKLSLAGWLSLGVEDRAELVLAGMAEGPSPGAALDSTARLGRAVPEPTSIEPIVEPDRFIPPSEIVDALGTARPLHDGVWQSLRALDRYALAKCSARPEALARAYDEIVATGWLKTTHAGPVSAGDPLVPSLPTLNSDSSLTHLTSEGHAHMVNVGTKGITARRAVASARVCTTQAVVHAIMAGGLPKGDVLAVARVAGLLAAKRTPELVPLCHPVQTTGAAIEFDTDPAHGELRVRATIEAIDRTGVEMEAMVSASVAALTVYDMVKSLDRWATVECVRLEEKSGGKSGPVSRPADRSTR